MRWSIEELFYAIKIVSGSGMSFTWRLIHIFKSTWRIITTIIKWIFTGYCSASLWNLDNYLITVIIQRLKMFRKAKRVGYPAEFNGKDEWNNILDQMIDGFEIMRDQSISDKAFDIIDKTNTSAKDIVLDIPSRLSDEERAQIIKAEKEQHISDMLTLRLFVKYLKNLWD